MEPRYDVESFNYIMSNFRQRLLEMAEDKKEWQEHVHTMKRVMDNIIQTANDRSLPIDPFIYRVKDLIPMDGSDHRAFWRVNEVFQRWREPYTIQNSMESAEGNGPTCSDYQLSPPSSTTEYAPPGILWGIGPQLMDIHREPRTFSPHADNPEILDAAKMLIAMQRRASHSPPHGVGQANRYQADGC